jgi:alkylation response protein AidB-like acyl-CoA dehydrogenase
MNFDFTDDQQAIKRTAHEFIAARYKPETVRAVAEEPGKATAEQWREIAELGWPGVIVPESDGGLGLGAVELVVIQEELGYAVVPSPFFATICAAALLVAAGTEEQKARWLAPLAIGDVKGTLAVWDEYAGFAPDRDEDRGSRRRVGRRDRRRGGWWSSLPRRARPAGRGADAGEVARSHAAAVDGGVA